jgi:hypothetical protein
VACSEAEHPSQIKQDLARGDRRARLDHYHWSARRFSWHPNNPAGNTHSRGRNSERKRYTKNNLTDANTNGRAIACYDDRSASSEPDTTAPHGG